MSFKKIGHRKYIVTEEFYEVAEDNQMKLKDILGVICEIIMVFNCEIARYYNDGKIGLPFWVINELRKKNDLCYKSNSLYDYIWGYKIYDIGYNDKIVIRLDSGDEFEFTIYEKLDILPNGNIFQFELEGI